MEEAFRLFKSTREYLTPVLTESAFLERGMLTPEEFVRAGDQLTRTCPSWTWERGETSKLRPYLPADKQFLLTRRVPSYSRVSLLTFSKLVEQSIKGGMGDREGDWCAPELLNPDDSANDDEVIVEVEDATEDNNSALSTSSNLPISSSSSNPHLKNEDYLDLEDESLALDDASTSHNSNAGALVSDTNDNNCKLLQARRYDVSITYDNYYRTPRIWMFGFNENGSALSTADIFQDIMQDYAKKTVTIDPHPHLSRPHASVHPCQHGPAMLNIIQALKECGGSVPSVEQYLFIFLKFIQSVVPTVEYDYTMDVQVRGKDSS